MGSMWEYDGTLWKGSDSMLALATTCSLTTLQRLLSPYPVPGTEDVVSKIDRAFVFLWNPQYDGKRGYKRVSDK